MAGPIKVGETHWPNPVLRRVVREFGFVLGRTFAVTVSTKPVASSTQDMPVRRRVRLTPWDPPFILPPPTVVAAPPQVLSMLDLPTRKAVSRVPVDFQNMLALLTFVPVPGPSFTRATRLAYLRM